MIDVGTYVTEAKQALASSLRVPVGYSLLERAVGEHAAGEGAAQAERAHHAGADRACSPKAMTVFAAFMRLLPIMWSTGSGGRDEQPGACSLRRSKNEEGPTNATDFAWRERATITPNRSRRQQ
jgi:hypothetical protein